MNPVKNRACHGPIFLLLFSLDPATGPGSVRGRQDFGVFTIIAIHECRAYLAHH